jgi:hypothetical protein
MEIDEHKARLAAARGIKAKELLENELLEESLTSLEAKYIEAWRFTNIEDVSGREKLFLAINIIGKIREHLGKVLADGNLAAADLRRLAETAERKKTWPEIR